jgi:hypothetical protein
MKLLENAHMPYVAVISSVPHLFFCRGSRKTSTFGESTYSYVDWHIYCALLRDPSISVQLAQGRFVEPVIQCNPCVRTEEGLVKLSFVCSEVRRNTPTNYLLYTLSGSSLADLSNFSFVNIGAYRMFNGVTLSGCTVFCRLSDIRVNRKDGGVDAFRTSFDEVLRVIQGRSSSEIIVTGRSGAEYRSVLFDLEDYKCKGEIFADRNPVYKCCIYGDKVYHAVRTGDFEGREIHSGDLSIEPCNITFTVSDNLRNSQRPVSDREIMTKILSMGVNNMSAGVLKGLLEKELV